MSEKQVIVRVNPNAYSDEVYILIPPKIWAHPLLADGIKQAVLDACGSFNTFDDDSTEH